MKVFEVAEALGLTAVTMPCPDREIEGGYVGDLLSWVMGRVGESNAWITIMSNINIVAVASLADVACIILAENVTVDDDVIATANEKCINILRSELSSFDLCVKLAQLTK